MTKFTLFVYFFVWLGFLNDFYICTNTHLFTSLVKCALSQRWMCWNIWRDCVVCEFVCVLIHKFGQRGGPPVGHGVFSHVVCVTLFSLFPLGFLHLNVQLMHCNSSLSDVCISFFVELPNALAKDISGWFHSVCWLCHCTHVQMCPMDKVVCLPSLFSHIFCF